MSAFQDSLTEQAVVGGQVQRRGALGTQTDESSSDAKTEVQTKLAVLSRDAL